MSTTTTTTTCTIGPDAVTGAQCGRHAVHTFTGRNGEHFAECDIHFVQTSTPDPAVFIGKRVEVAHGGKIKIGTITRVGRTRVSVEVPSRDGVKIIERAIEDVR